AKSEAFADIRKHYPVRREFSALELELPNDTASKKNNKSVAQMAASIGFKIAN
ncbi:MAG: erythronate-4-phosphate dehydrogenase, partial [Glaciecola sp.]